MEMIPPLGRKVCKWYLLWVMWIRIRASVKVFFQEFGGVETSHEHESQR